MDCNFRRNGYNVSTFKPGLGAIFMKRMMIIIAAFAVFALLTLAAQAEAGGEKIFRQKCTMCHTVNGKGGQYGPNLTGVYSRLGEKRIMEKLNRPKNGNPSSRMPSFRTLPEADMKALMAYVRTLK